MKYFEDYTLVVPRIPLARAHHPTRPRFLAENYFFVTESLLGLSPLLSVPPHHEAEITASHFYPTLIDRCSWTGTGQIRTQPAEVSQGHWSSVQAGLGFYTDLAHRPDICHRLLSFLRTSRGWLGHREHPPGKVVSQNFFIREKYFRAIRCPDWCFTVLCQVLGLSMCGFPGLLQRSQAGRGDMT